MALLEFTDDGIYCPQADVYIDPWKPVKRALITHGHADHSRWGNKYYLCTDTAAPVIRYRLSLDAKTVESVPYGQTVSINGVKFSFHPAGHIIGSAQIRVEYKGEIWVASGDYKIQKDGLSEDFESVKCHAFITESTFGLPVYNWTPQQEVFDDINQWWRENSEAGKVTVITGYSLGKAQRILQNLDPSIGPIFTHGAVENINQVIRAQGIDLHPTQRWTRETPKDSAKGGLVIAPPAAVNSPWIKNFKNHSIGIASGWMTLRGARRRRSVDRGFVLSDHADWNGLLTAIEASECEQVFVTHGYTSLFQRYLTEQGYKAAVVSTEYEGELGELGESSATESEETLSVE